MGFRQGASPATQTASGDLDDRQLAALMRTVKVPAGPAAILVACAHPESHGDPLAINPDDNNGTQSSYGIWQVSNGTHSPPSPQWANPQVNAKLAAGKLATQGLSAWGTYDSGAYLPFLPAAQAAVSEVYALPVAEVRKLAKSAQHGTPAAPVTTTSAVSGVGSLLQSGGGILHGSALMLDRFLAVGAPGQGWRFVFGVGTVAASVGSYKAFTTEGEGDHLPLAIALAGVASIGAFLTLRPWPQTSGGAIKPGAYLVDVIKGQAPPAGPQSISPGQVDLTETFLGGLVALWAAGKIGQAGSSLGNLLGQLGLGGAGEGDDGGGEPVEAPPVPEAV